MRRLAPLLSLAVVAPALADVQILARHSEVHSGYNDPFNPGSSYSYTDTTDAFGPVTLHAGAREFTSNASPALISASLSDNSFTGGFQSYTSGGHTTMMNVTFVVTDAPANVTITLNGSIFPFSVPQSQTSGTHLSMTNTSTSVLAYELYRDTPATVTGFIPQGDWTNVTWSGILQPGIYALSSSSVTGLTYSAGGGSGSSGGGHLTYSIVLTPTPSAACLFTAGLVAAGRRRSRP